MKHLYVLTKLPEKADDFTTGQKLTLAAGILDAVAGFFAAKEFVDDSGSET